MLKKCVKRAFVFLLCVSYLVINPHFSFFSVKNVYALPSSVMVKGTSVNVRSGPGTSYSLLGTVPLGYKLTPTESLNDATGNGKTWYRFRYNNQNAYIRSDFTKEMSTYVYDAAFENDLNIKGLTRFIIIAFRVKSERTAICPLNDFFHSAANQIC